MVPGARLIVLGKQGAGKGTQCVRLSHRYVVPHISTGDMLRVAVKSGTPLGLQARRYLDAGDLIPDEVVLAMVAARLDQDDTRTRGFVLDGFPRTVAQADGLDELLKPVAIDLVLNLVVPTGMVLGRLVSRRVCEDCGAIYSTSAPPKLNWSCDICGGEVVQREDDTEEAIKNRLDLYDSSTAPLVERYAALGKLVEVWGVGSPDEVTNSLTAAIDAYQHGGGFLPPTPARAQPLEASRPLREPPLGTGEQS
ncbi:MAG: adenylate kinase [Acidimicrobiales bacterium]